MADQFDKKTFLDKFKQKSRVKGFELNPDKSKLPKNFPTTLDLLEIVAETLAEVLYQDQNLSGTLKAKDFKIGPSGLQQPVAYKTATVKADATTDPKFFTWMETFHSVLQGVYPEPGNGSPNVFATALKSLLASKPTSITAKITQGSGKIKVTT